MKMKQVRYYLFASIAFAALPLVSFATGSFVSGPTALANFVNTNFGQVNMAPTNGGVTITETSATGYGWGNYIGWINFNPTNGGVSVSCSSGIAGLTGYAWSQTGGWINFGPFSGGSAAVPVKIDSSGAMSGHAWVQNAGWLDFSGVQTSFTCPNPPPSSGPDKPSCSLSVSQQQVTIPGSPVTLSWRLKGSNPKTFTIPSLNVSSTVNDSVVVTPQQTTTYVGSVSNADGSATCRQTVIVSVKPSVLACTNKRALNYNADKFDTTLYNIVDNGRCVFDPTETYELEYIEEALTNQSCSYFATYLKRGTRGIEVAKVQNFLNKYMNAGIKVDGVFGQTTVDAVKKFQARHSAEIIDPWRPFLTKPSGWWYKTTAGTANIIVGCTQIPVFLETPKIEYAFESATKNLFNKLFNLVKPENKDGVQ